MRKKFNFWGVFVTPWTIGNRLLLGLYILVLICVTLGVVYVTSGWMSFHMFWLFLMPAGFYAIYLVVDLLVDRLRKKLPPGPVLQTDCIIVNNVVQTPGIAHLRGDQLILKPLAGKQISIPISDIQQIRERRWYNGQGYWGQTIFFEFPAMKQWRLGFGVVDAKVWRDALYYFRQDEQNKD